MTIAASAEVDLSEAGTHTTRVALIMPSHAGIDLLYAFPVREKLMQGAGLYSDTIPLCRQLARDIERAILRRVADTLRFGSDVQA